MSWDQEDTGSFGHREDPGSKGDSDWDGSDTAPQPRIEYAVDPVRRELIAAERLLDAERPKQAEERLRLALAQAPNDPDLHSTLARAFLNQNRIVDAEDAARQALVCDPGDDHSHLVLGLIQMELGRNQEAESHMLEALRIAPDRSSGHLAYARLMFRTGHLDKAERLARRTLQLDPEEADAHQLLTLIKAEQRKLSDAQREGLASARISPDDAWSQYSLGIAAREAGRPFKARAHFREALRMNPSQEGFEEAYLNTDLYCRWLGLPLFYFSWVASFVPGENIGLWAIFVGGWFLMGHLGFGENPVVNWIFYSYVALCLYTWVATPLARAWTKLVPPK